MRIAAVELFLGLACILGQNVQISPVNIDSIPAFASDLPQNAGLTQGIDGLRSGRLGDLEHLNCTRQSYHSTLSKAAPSKILVDNG